MHVTGKVTEAYWRYVEARARSAGRAALVEHRRVCSSPTKARLVTSERSLSWRNRAQAIACAGQSSRPPPSCSPAMRPGGSPRTSSSLAGCCVSRSNPDELVSHLNALQSRLKIFKVAVATPPPFYAPQYLASRCGGSCRSAAHITRVITDTTGMRAER